jgi:hypothetical protein
LFGFPAKFPKLSPQEILEHATALGCGHDTDLEERLCEECLHFKEHVLIREDNTPATHVAY